MLMMHVLYSRLAKIFSRLALHRLSCKSYSAPRPKIVMNVTFLYVAICRPYSSGIGVTSTTTSVSRFMIPVTVKEVTWFPHDPPGILWSQLYAKGRHIRHPASIVPIVQATITPTVVQQTRTTHLTGKMLRYKDKMEIFVQLRLRTQRNCNGTISWRSLVIGPSPYVAAIVVT